MTNKKTPAYGVKYAPYKQENFSIMTLKNIQTSMHQNFLMKDIHDTAPNLERHLGLFHPTGFAFILPMTSHTSKSIVMIQITEKTVLQKGTNCITHPTQTKEYNRSVVFIDTNDHAKLLPNLKESGMLRTDKGKKLDKTQKARTTTKPQTET